MYVGMCWVRRESTQVHREGGTVSSKGKTCSVRDHDGGGSQGAGSVRRCSGRPRVDHSSLCEYSSSFSTRLVRVRPVWCVRLFSAMKENISLLDNSRFFNSSQQGTSGTSAASFSHRVPLFRRVPLLQQGPVGVPLLMFRLFIANAKGLFFSPGIHIGES